MSCHSAPGANAIDRSGGSERHTAAHAGGLGEMSPPLPSTRTELAWGGWGLGMQELHKSGCRQRAKPWRAELGFGVELFFSDVRSWQHRVLQRPPQARRVLRFTALEASPSFTCAAIATAGAAERGRPGQGHLHRAMPTAGTISTARTGQEPSTRLRAAVVAPEQYHQPGGLLGS